ncbi:MAG TPA: hypothetical protein PLJ27_03370 [Polyangiaceae bacterium]|nr:hypothetical protein [Polyangiaceae bacterium]HNZ24009.1 hypothetical protein [Polyangiaceae bacterium]HOD21739.1 hypothetical protein [Polyangiaceae bacterium]HOE51091.1 hypothetical protein [Polyangiaceae bacterium]HOH03744.1 hypothetical protein [Polyangiaceae bacterium]
MNSGLRWILLLSPMAMIHCGTSLPPSKIVDSKPVSGSAAVGDRDDSANVCPEVPIVSMVLRISTPNGSRWMVHERQASRQDEFFPGVAEEMARPMTEGEAKQNGMASVGSTVWVYTNDEAPPCGMQAGAPWAVHYGDGALRTHLFMELSGQCPLDDQAPSYLAIRGVQEARGCRMHSLPVMAADEQGVGSTVMPADVRKLLPDNHCEEPKCFRWIALGGHVDGGAGIYEVGAVWIHPVEGDEPACAAPFDGFHGVYFQPTSNAPWQEIPEVTGVRSMFFDRRGLRGIVTDAEGVLEVFVVGPNGLQKVSEQRYMSWNEENRGRIEEIQPSCF